MTRAKFLAALLVAGLAAGCASQPATVGAYGDPWVDRDRVAAVEREARRTGVEVRWVNPPTRRDARG